MDKDNINITLATPMRAVTVRGRKMTWTMRAIRAWYVRASDLEFLHS